MCELLGLSFARPISADFSIRVFALRAQENADGWGLAWYPDKSLAIVKEAVDWRQSAHSRFLETYQTVESRFYIAHVRHRSTGGAPTHANTHPFDREMGGCHFAFAHNGTLIDYSGLRLKRFRPLGGTDSEYLFCHLLDTIAEGNESLADEMSWKSLHLNLHRLNSLGTLNCILCDGTRLFAYHDLTAFKGLTLRKMSFSSSQERRLEDATVEINLESDQLNHGFVVATCPLGGKGWHKFQPGQLVVLEEGRLVYSSHPLQSLA